MKTRTIKQSEFLVTIKQTTEKSGYMSCSVKSFMNRMGYKKRSPKNIEELTDTLTEANFHIYPQLSLDLKHTDTIRIYDFPVHCLGDLFDNEADLEKFVFRKGKITEAGVASIKNKQFRPVNTRDRLDMVGYDLLDNPVVLELKNLDGGRSSVEQVFRYIKHLKTQFPEKTVRGVLVTGVKGKETAEALVGMQHESPQLFKLFSWYLYKFNGKRQTISFQLVDVSTLSHFFQRGVKNTSLKN
ncbi:MAG TPA: endonuclease NucS domain-containing protein [Chitinophagales bacterium]|nr:endonuclease NucS domain-containing protein [Chitinophagales bacterium]